MSASFLFAKAGLKAYARSSYKHFSMALESPLAAQQETLKNICEITGRKALPEVPQQWGDRELFQTREKTLFTEMTSGSGGRKKEIPYTPALLRAFRRMAGIWLYDAISNSPTKLNTGRIFMSISPRISTVDKEMGIGIDNDADYLGGPLQFLFAKFLVVSPKIQALDTNDFFDKVCFDLVHDETLEIISIWSPTYFLAIWDEILKRRKFWLNSRSKRLQKIFSNEFIAPLEVWPNLKMISCWTDGNSQGSARSLAGLFPGIWLQGKGLLATETPITMPWRLAQDQAVPLINEVYIEGLDNLGRLTPIWEWREGEVYEICVTTFGGLARYKIGDLVQVTGFFAKTPTLQFIGRTGQVSDLVGEKLDEAMIRELFLRANLPRGILAAHLSQTRPGYLFFFDKNNISECNLAALQEKLDEELNTIYHYRLATQLKQLEKVIVIPVTGLHKAIFEFFSVQGISRGNLKEQILWKHPELSLKLINWLNSRSLAPSDLLAKEKTF